MNHSATDAVKTVTSKTFHSLVTEAMGPIAVEFMSYSCSSCQAIDPILEQVAETLKSKVSIYRVNVVLDEKLAEAYKIEATPTLILFRNGAQLGRVEGPDPTVASLTNILTQPFQS